MSIIETIIVLIIILIIFYLLRAMYYSFDTFSIRQNILIKSSIDGKKYFVHSRHENLITASDVFAQVNKTIDEFLNKLYLKYYNSTDKIKKDAVNLLVSKYNPSSYRENSPNNLQKDTSYTINKGEIIAICIRSGSDNEIHDLNTILFVVLHELTHLAIIDYDHPDDFWKTFKFILIEAEYLISYKSPDFYNYPVEYCGIKITYNPRYDSTLNSI
jgi:hypothetical protein